MAQITLRVDDRLAADVKAAATSSGQSVNEYLTRVLRAATDPETAGTDVARLRERLARAGLLAETGGALAPAPPDAAAVAEAGRRAATGTLVSDLVTEGRSGAGAAAPAGA